MCLVILAGLVMMGVGLNMLTAGNVGGAGWLIFGFAVLLAGWMAKK